MEMRTRQEALVVSAQAQTASGWEVVHITNTGGRKSSIHGVSLFPLHRWEGGGGGPSEEKSVCVCVSNFHHSLDSTLDELISLHLKDH